MARATRFAFGIACNEPYDSQNTKHVNEPSRVCGGLQGTHIRGVWSVIVEKVIVFRNAYLSLTAKKCDLEHSY